MGWTTTRTDGSVETCQRAGDFDPANPRYICTGTDGPAEDNDPGGEPPS
jgi:hypothetical protein